MIWLQWLWLFAVLAAMTSMARLDPFTRGTIVGLRAVGVTRDDIVQRVRKKDGKRPTLRAVDGVLARHREEPAWRGEDSRAGGRPPLLTAKERKLLLNLVLAERGKAKVTVPYCRRRLPFLRKVSESTVRRELFAAGFAYLRRRGKTAVPKEFREQRLVYCRWTLRQSASDLRRYAYTDGTTFYLARGLAENYQKQRAALGPFVWRMADGKDGLWDEHVGPSLYAKAQGRPVKIWGFFCDGALHYHILPRDGQRTTNMNGRRYVDLVNSKFAVWRRSCTPRAGRVFLVQDHERCLWQDASLKALKAAGCDVVTRHTKHSPDLNAIEAWWGRLKKLLETKAPAELESRSEFLKRLRRTVTWLNTRERTSGRALCRGQKRRARAVLKLAGAKCKY